MAEHCTIFCSKDPIELTPALSGRPDVVISGPVDRWEGIVVRAPNSQLTFNALRFTKPQDKFSKIVLGAVNFARKGVPVENRDSVMDRVAEAKLIIGVVAEPEFEDQHDEWITWIATMADGLILEQDATFVDPEGDVVLDCGS